MTEEERKPWYFTFGYGHQQQNCYTTFHGTHEEARQKMVDKYGLKWSHQYSSKEAAGVNEFNLTEI